MTTMVRNSGKGNYLNHLKRENHLPNAINLTDWISLEKNDVMYLCVAED
jgi:hypothetical protein